MMRMMLRAKVFYATIVDLQLYYKGSITIDEEIMRKADLKEGERVDVLNLNTGARLQTYVIKGAAKSGMVCLNGPAARTAFKGDKIVIIAYALYNEEELKQYKARYVELDDKNGVKNTDLASAAFEAEM